MEIVVSPTAVQGGCLPADSDSNPWHRWESRVIIVARGGGSFEDIFPFNHPEVVKAIAACRTPVVNAIGHEVEVICDSVADVRAPTPSVWRLNFACLTEFHSEKYTNHSGELRSTILQRLDRNGHNGFRN